MIILFLFTLTDSCLNLAPKTHFRYVSWSKIYIAVFSTDSCYFWETDFSRNGDNLYKSLAERALNSGLFGHFKSLNLCFRFILLDKNNSRIRKTPSNLNNAHWAVKTFSLVKKKKNTLNCQTALNTFVVGSALGIACN